MKPQDLLARLEAGYEYDPMYGELCNERDRLADENAKLRELVRHMYECMCNVDADGNHECYSCEYENTDGGCDFERMMRKFGVEL